MGPFQFWEFAVLEIVEAVYELFAAALDDFMAFAFFVAMRLVPFQSSSLILCG